jgi:serine/threonine protein kinase
LLAALSSLALPQLPHTHCLLYEFCSGGSLHSFLIDTDLPYECLSIALDIANGMAYLHSHDIIHRDLKSTNVLLDGNGR